MNVRKNNRREHIEALYSKQHQRKGLTYLKPFYDSLSLNRFSSSFLYDLNEIYYILKTHYYDDEFISEFIKTIKLTNLKLSYFSSQVQSMTSISALLSFVLSLGYSGYEGSTYDRVNP